MHRHPVNLTSRRCTCGARVEQGRPACPKCRARARWVRRKTYHPATDDL